jgi:hypothetical protein
MAAGTSYIMGTTKAGTMYTITDILQNTMILDYHMDDFPTKAQVRIVQMCFLCGVLDIWFR